MSLKSILSYSETVSRGKKEKQKQNAKITKKEKWRMMTYLKILKSI